VGQALLAAAFGAFSLLSQVLVLREVSFLFLGHELSLGLALSGWILWSGVGSFHFKSRRPLIPLALCVCSAPLSLLLAREASRLLPAGAVPGLFAILALSLALTAPAGLCAGWFCASVMSVPFYIFEAAGAFAGGAVFTFLLAGKVRPMSAACAAGALLLLAEAAAGRREDRRLRAGLWALCAAACALGFWRDLPSRGLRYARYALEREVETPYGRFALASGGGHTVLLEDGFVSGQVPDPASSEETAHLPLLAHPKPKSVFVAGTPGLLALPEILKHKPETLEAAEIDGRKAETVLGMLSLGRGVLLREEDPRQALRSSPGRYDVILQTVPEPVNAAANRLFTLEFFREAKAALKPGGILAFTVPSSENYLSPEEGYLAACLLKTVREAFPSVALVPGRRMLVLASEKPLDISPALLEARYRARRLKTTALVPAAFPILLHAQRRQWLEQSIEKAGRPSLNSDLDPVSYFITWRVWLSKFVSPGYLLGACASLLLLLWALGLVLSRWRDWLGENDLMGLFAMGFWGMTLEVALMLCAQSALGALHWQMGLLFASFMLGLALGGACFKPVRGGAWVLLLLLVSAAAVSAGLARAAGTLVRLEGAGGLWALLGLQAGVGALVGAAFPPALALARHEPSRLYACDLWGSCLGGALCASTLVPLLGLKPALLISGLPCLAAALLCLPSLRRP